jgi:hypothetical protein
VVAIMALKAVLKSEGLLEEDDGEIEDEPPAGD